MSLNKLCKIQSDCTEWPGASERYKKKVTSHINIPSTHTSIPSEVFKIVLLVPEFSIVVLLLMSLYLLSLKLREK